MLRLLSLTVTPAVSSSATLTATESTAMPAYSLAPLTEWLTLAVSLAASASWAAWTVTVWAVCQLLVVKVRLDGCVATSPLSLRIVITTLAVGSPSRTTV